MSLTATRPTARQLERGEVEVWRDFFRAAPEEVRASCGISSRDLGGATAFTVASFPGFSLNHVTGLGIEAPADEETLDALLDEYHSTGVKRYAVQMSPDARPEGLGAWLAGRGLRLENRWMKLYREARNPPEVKPGLHVEQVGVERAEDFALVLLRAFGWSESFVPWVAATVCRANWRHYLAFEGGRPVGAAALFVWEDCGYFGFAGTLAEARGRGAQSALIARRARDAAEAGCRWLVVETAEDSEQRPAPSFRNLRRLGFAVAYPRPNYVPG
ncbi:MAG TPA: GNAT family N-acetyltransferase [Deinococcales bacterium]|nr:GNAT family N-acetyltransferase [Deinococcales bacterium]